MADENTFQSADFVAAILRLSRFRQDSITVYQLGDQNSIRDSFLSFPIFLILRPLRLVSIASHSAPNRGHWALSARNIITIISITCVPRHFKGTANRKVGGLGQRGGKKENRRKNAFANCLFLQFELRQEDKNVLFRA